MRSWMARSVSSDSISSHRSGCCLLRLDMACSPPLLVGFYAGPACPSIALVDVGVLFVVGMSSTAMRDRRVVSASHLVQAVFGAGIPPQVLKAVVARVTVVVAAFGADRRLADKGQEDEPVHRKGEPLVRMIAESNALVSPRFRNRFHDPALEWLRTFPVDYDPIARANAANVADFIEALKAWNRKPTFIAHRASLALRWQAHVQYVCTAFGGLLCMNVLPHSGHVFQFSRRFMSSEP